MILTFAESYFCEGAVEHPAHAATKWRTSQFLADAYVLPETSFYRFQGLAILFTTSRNPFVVP
jgi:hypothetical protein